MTSETIFVGPLVADHSRLSRQTWRGHVLGISEFQTLSSRFEGCDIKRDIADRKHQAFETQIEFLAAKDTKDGIVWHARFRMPPCDEGTPGQACSCRRVIHGIAISGVRVHWNHSIPRENVATPAARAPRGHVTGGADTLVHESKPMPRAAHETSVANAATWAMAFTKQLESAPVFLTLEAPTLPAKIKEHCGLTHKQAQEPFVYGAKQAVLLQADYRNWHHLPAPGDKPVYVAPYCLDIGIRNAVTIQSQADLGAALSKFESLVKSMRSGISLGEEKPVAAGGSQWTELYRRPLPQESVSDVAKRACFARHHVRNWSEFEDSNVLRELHMTFVTIWTACLTGYDQTVRPETVPGSTGIMATSPLGGPAATTEKAKALTDRLLAAIADKDTKEVFHGLATGPESVTKVGTMLANGNAPWCVVLERVLGHDQVCVVPGAEICIGLAAGSESAMLVLGRISDLLRDDKPGDTATGGGGDGSKKGTVSVFATATVVWNQISCVH